MGCLTVLALAAVAGQPELTNAQEGPGGEVTCRLCQETEVNTHFFWPWLGCGEVGGEVRGPSVVFVPLGIDAECRRCGNTSYCHADAWEGPCHLPCDLGETSLAALGETARTLIEHARSLRSEESAITLMALITEDARLEFNLDRKAVQLLDCQQAVVGHWRVSDDLADTLARRFSANAV